MKAAIVRQVGAKVEVVDVDVRDPGPGEVRLRIAATGVCHSDLSFQNGTLPGMLPAILGHEGAGVVTHTGPGVTSVKPGDHVILNWVPSCGACYFCNRGQFQLCGSPRGASEPKLFLDGVPIPGVAGMGTFAEEMVVSENAVVPIPDDVPMDVAALIGCGVMTGAGAALNTAQVEPGSSVVVIGCGGVGINTIQGAKVCGAATILAVDRYENKREMAKRFGATHAAAPEELPQAMQDLTAGRGFDYGFEVIGLAATIRQAWDATRRGGKTIVVGAGRFDDMLQLSAFELFFMEKQLVGSVYGSANVRRDFPRLIALWRSGKLDLEGLVTRHVQLGQVQEAFEAMERGEVIRQVVTFE
ncbi:MAG TPA: Zn-dependent alcohol dehydrogenase [Dehalococcoidia bacterium]|nr:Zn-dependent alcohol dehydrogenase [Dehalococcoidia bacterium]